MKNRITLGVSMGVLTAVLATAPAPVAAQGAPPPVQISPPTREEIEPPAAPAPPAQPRVKIEGGEIERSPCALSDPAYADVKVKITGAEFDNVKEVSPEELKPAYQGYMGQEVPVSAICEIRDAAATILRRKGYLAAVQVPTQRIENGIVKFEVLFARIVSVRVRGDAGKAEGLIASYLNRLSEAEVFNRFAVERYLLLARDLPGYDVRLSLTPSGTGPGELIGEVTVTRTPLDADINFQNYASKDTGRFGGQIRAQYYGLTGMGDRTTIALYSTADTHEQQILQLGHEFRVGSEGLTLGGRFTYAWTRPDLGSAIDVNAHTLFTNIEASYPFKRSQALTLRGAAGVDFVNQTVRFNGTPLSRDRLRVLYGRLDFDTTDTSSGRVPLWRAVGSLELRRGLGIFNATDGGTGTPGPSRNDGDATATVVRFSGQFEYNAGPGLSFALLPRAQKSFDPLLSFEEYSAGTYSIGRGYDPGTIIGDSGVGASFEVRLGRLTPFKGLDYAVQPFAFVDSAWVWDRARTGDPQRLTSVGGGIRSSYADRVRIDLTIAVPTKAAGLQTQKPDPRLLFTVTTKLWPWAS